MLYILDEGTYRIGNIASDKVYPVIIEEVKEAVGDYWRWYFSRTILYRIYQWEVSASSNLNTAHEWYFSHSAKDETGTDQIDTFHRKNFLEPLDTFHQVIYT